MNDCSNAEIRDLLPDLLHDRLEVSQRAAVQAHVADCVDCREELALLRSVHGMLMRSAPRVDVAYVVGALPRAAGQRRERTPKYAVAVDSSRSGHSGTLSRRWTDWRIAAAAAVLIVGGSSAAVLARDGHWGAAANANHIVQTASASGRGSASTVASSAMSAVQTADATTPSDANVQQADAQHTVASGTDDATSVGLGASGRLANLSEQQLESLLGDIAHLQAVPVTEPEPVTIAIDDASTPEGA